MLQPLTSEAQQVIASSHLGIPTAAYRAKFTIKKAIAVAFLFAVGLGILAVAILDSSSVLLSTVIAVVISSVLFLAIPLWIVVDAVRSRDIQVYVCPGGLLYLHSGKTEAIRWDQIESFWRKVIKNSSYGIQTGTTHRYTLRRSDGVTFKFNDTIGNVEALGNTIAGETARTLWPRYIAAYQAGQTLPFGKISLNQQGVNQRQGVASLVPAQRDSNHSRISFSQERGRQAGQLEGQFQLRKFPMSTCSWLWSMASKAGSGAENPRKEELMAQ